MNIQIFGTKKSFDTKKAQRYFKERRVKFQFIDLKEKGMSKGELESVARAVGGIDAVIDPKGKMPTRLRSYSILLPTRNSKRCSITSRFFVSPSFATAARQPLATSLTCGRAGNKAAGNKAKRPRPWFYPRTRALA